MPRAIWIDAGNDANAPKLHAAGIDAAYFDIRDPRITYDYLRGVVAQGFTAGVYAVASWYPALSGSAFATAVSHRLDAILESKPGDPAFPMVCLDIEKDDVRGYVLPALAQWRRHRPKRVTDLTIEGHKGGIFSPSDVIQVVAKVRYTVPQCYNGAMSQVWDTYAMTCNLVAAGFPVAGICPFYDAAHLPDYWGIPAGYAFTQGRLP